ncbi:unnamed protein product [Caenorhabditis bovis]|uniref:MARVEL domain-containing protein n=1 Tax=Caenorhabditis bovis TaxID=2654633 RepID=A0A8S1F1L0_9PELO|nr:unnamed protein product [Caenorhabditis bovis]
MNDTLMRYKETPSRDIYYEDHKRVCCGRMKLKTACLTIAGIEIIYWAYYLILLFFAIIHHQQAWSAVFTGVSLLTLTIQVLLIFYGVLTENPKYLQTHLVFLTLTFIYDLVLACIFFGLTIFPNAYSNHDVKFKGGHFNARTFGIVMGSLLILWFIARIFALKIIYRYWKLLRILHGYGRNSVDQ